MAPKNESQSLQAGSFHNQELFFHLFSIHMIVIREIGSSVLTDVVSAVSESPGSARLLPESSSTVKTAVVACLLYQIKVKS